MVEYYQGILEDVTTEALVKGLMPEMIIETNDLMYREETIKEIVHQDVTDDRIFGYLTRLNIEASFDTQKVLTILHKLSSLRAGTVFIAGTGAAFIATHHDILV